MELTTREEIAAPQTEVWEALTDFDRFERLARRRGAAVTRGGTPARPEWQSKVTFRGIERDVELRVSAIEPMERVALSGRGAGLGGVLTATLSPLGPDRTALDLTLEVRGTNLAGKAMVQGMRMAHGPIQERFVKRVQGVVKDIAKTLGKGVA
jgi:uncharacterized protein YndB with AHSA1/START domain